MKRLEQSGLIPMALRIGSNAFGIPRGFNDIKPKGVLANRGLGQFARGLGQFRQPNPQQELISQLRLRRQLNQFLGGGLGAPQAPTQPAPQAPQIQQPAPSAAAPQLPQTAKFNVDQFRSSVDIRRRLSENRFGSNQLTPEMVRVLLSRKRILQNEEITADKTKRREERIA